MHPSKLTLWFVRRGDGPVQLSRTTFLRQDMTQPREAERGPMRGRSSGPRASSH